MNGVFLFGTLEKKKNETYYFVAMILVSFSGKPSLALNSLLHTCRHFN